MTEMEAKTEKERGKKEKEGREVGKGEKRGRLKNRGEDLRNNKGRGGVEVTVVGKPNRGKVDPTWYPQNTRLETRETLQEVDDDLFKGTRF